MWRNEIWVDGERQGFEEFDCPVADGMLNGEEPYRGCRRHRREEGDESLLQALPSSVKNRQIGHRRMSSSFRG